MFDLILQSETKQLNVYIYKRYGVHVRRLRFIGGSGGGGEDL